MKQFFQKFGFKKIVFGILTTGLLTSAFSIMLPQHWGGPDAVYADTMSARDEAASHRNEADKQKEIATQKMKDGKPDEAKIAAKTARDEAARARAAATQAAKDAEKEKFGATGEERLEIDGRVADAEGEAKAAEQAASEAEKVAGLAPPDDTPPDEQTINIGKIASFLVSIFTPLIAMLVNFIGKMMGTEVIYGSFGSSEGKDFADILYVIWLMIRDLVNYCFILVLLAIAFITVFGAANPENNNMELKKVLPKFVLAVVAVNFTWFGAKALLDVANVTTHVVFAIPKTLGISIGESTGDEPKCTDKTEESSGVLSVKDCVPMAVFIKGESGKKLGAFKIENGKFTGIDDPRYTKEAKFVEDSSHADAKYVEDFGKFVIIWTDFKWKRFQENSIAALFAYNVLQIQNLPRSVQDELGEDTDIENILVGTIFSLLFMVIIIVAFLTITVVLFERTIMIWVNIILSPIGALLLVVKDLGLEPPGGEESGVGLKPFVKYAFLPALLALPLELGYILIMAGQSITTKSDIAGGVIFDTELIHNVHTVHALMWYVLAVAVLWSSTKVAESTAVHLKEVVGKITSVATDVGKFLGKLPLYWQFIPTGTSFDDDDKPDSTNIMTMLAAVKTYKSDFENKPYENVRKLMNQDGGDTTTRIREQSRQKLNEHEARRLQPILTDHASKGGGDPKLIAGLLRQDPEFQKLYGSNIQPGDVEAIYGSVRDIAKQNYNDNVADGLANKGVSASTPPATPPRGQPQTSSGGKPIVGGVEIKIEADGKTISADGLNDLKAILKGRSMREIDGELDQLGQYVHEGLDGQTIEAAEGTYTIKKQTLSGGAVKYDNSTPPKGGT